VRDQVAVEVRLAQQLGISRYATVVGGSMGGMRALEWAVGYPDRIGSAVVLATGAAATGDQIGTQSAQILAITSDPDWHGGDYVDQPAGLGLARRIAHLTYRSEHELDTRFGRRAQPGEDPLGSGRYAVQSYLDHHADKLVARFDAGSYVTLTDAMNTHDVGRNRGGVAAALRAITAPVVVGGIDTDRLYPLRLQSEIATLTPTCDHLDVIESPYGHDGFLIEVDAVSALVRTALSSALVR
jgi:homoserine O-acetyltransferase